MFRKYLLPTLAASTLLLVTAIVTCAQTGELRGNVKLKQADGTTVPAVGAVIDVFRTDLSGKYNTKTDKKGEFVFAGLPYVGTYIVAASLAGAQPDFQREVKAGREIECQIILSPGDGKRLTLDEINAIIKGAGAKAPATTGGGTSGGSSADKAKQAEIDKKNAEIVENNKKIEATNAIVARTFKAGNDAVIAGNEASRANPPNRAEAIKKFGEAITQFEEGLTADPEQSALWTNKGLALKARGVERYNEAIKSTDDATKPAALDAAKADFKAAAESEGKAVELIKTQPAPTDPEALKRHDINKLAALSYRAEAMRLYVSKGDPTQADTGVTAYDEYLAVETDAAKKSKAEHDMARMLFDANSFEKAKAAYDKILTQNPDDAEALQNVGLILFNMGALKEGEGKKDEAKASYQEAANYLQRFVDKSPDGQIKTEAQDILKNLKDQQNVQAEKAATPNRKRRP
jgi:tetratricopeptide (TPR) repeat protein